jgi:hypothetical protein
MADELVRRDRCWEENNWYPRCSHDRGVQIINSYQYQNCVSCKVIENLRSDLEEFNNILGIANVKR